MPKPELDYYTFAELERKWKEHDISAGEIVTYCEQGQLTPSVLVRSCEVIAFINNPDYESSDETVTAVGPWISVGVCIISGVFRFQDVHLPQMLHGDAETIYYFTPRGPQLISDWRMEKPNSLGKEINKLYQVWSPQPQADCENQITVFGAYPTEFIVPPDTTDEISTRSISRRKLREFKQAVPNYEERISLCYDQSQFSYTDIRITAEEVRAFESNYLGSSHKKYDIPPGTDCRVKPSSGGELKFTYKELTRKNDLASFTICYLRQWAQENDGEAPTATVLFGYLKGKAQEQSVRTKTFGVTWDEISSSLCYGKSKTTDYDSFRNGPFKTLDIKKK